MNAVLSAGLKAALLATGHYRRRFHRDRFPGVAVLCYHAVRPDEWPAGTMAFEGLHVRASEFDAHCRLLTSSCHPITLAQWQAALDGGPPLPDRPVLVTFDDGYRTVATVAHPILERHGIPAVLFACSSPIEERRLFWYDAVARRSGESEVQRLKQVPFALWRAATCGATHTAAGDGDPEAPLSVDEVRRLAQGGFEIGGHTATHPILARADRDRQREEIARNRQAIGGWIGRPPVAFAYPNGERSDYTSETLSILRELSYDMAFTTESGFASGAERLECPRLLMLAGVSEAELAHRLSYSWRPKAGLKAHFSLQT
jgi:peptidoglycan/xylan/chitin deacetylase (PgdA/CDA1 family)